jgi:hypothetical protein
VNVIDSAGLRDALEARYETSNEQRCTKLMLRCLTCSGGKSYYFPRSPLSAISVALNMICVLTFHFSRPECQKLNTIAHISRNYCTSIIYLAVFCSENTFKMCLTTSSSNLHPSTLNENSAVGDNQRHFLV